MSEYPDVAPSPYPAPPRLTPDANGGSNRWTRAGGYIPQPDGFGGEQGLDEDLYLIPPATVRQLHQRAGDAMQAEQKRRRALNLEPLSGESEQQHARDVIQRVIDEWAVSVLEDHQSPIGQDGELRLAEAIFARMYGAGALQPLLEDDSIESINVNGPKDVFVKRVAPDGRRVTERVDPVVDSVDELIDMVQVLAAYSGLSSRAFDTSNPQLDLRLPDGSRLSAVMSVTDEPAVSIRRNRYTDPTLTSFVGNGTLTQECADFLRAAVKAQMNVMIAGATGAGKTSLLRALAAEFDPDERVITIEQSLELGLSRQEHRHRNIIEMEERLANNEGEGRVAMHQLVRRTLRMEPDRIIVGEVLGPEIMSMLLAMTQGNRGSLSTIHAHSAYDVPNRVAMYTIFSEHQVPFASVNLLVAGSFDLIVFLREDRWTGQRRVDSVVEVSRHLTDAGQVAFTDIFRPDREGVAQRVHENILASDRADAFAAAGWKDGVDVAEGAW